MKRVLFCILLMIMIFPVVINAKESCTIVSGNGTNIGSEIACGSEHFYIIDNKNNELKMLSKYNLYVGAIYNKINLNINDIYIINECLDDSCSNYRYDSFYFEGREVDSIEEWETLIADKYDLDYLFYSNDYINNGVLNTNETKAVAALQFGDIYTQNNKKYVKSTYKLYPYTVIDENTDGYALQNKLALGVTGDKNKANYPIYATMDFLTYDHENYNPNYLNELSIDNFEDGYTNINFKSNFIYIKYLNDYKEKLIDRGYDVKNVDLLSIDELDDLVFSINKKRLPLVGWYYNSSFDHGLSIYDDNDFEVLGDLKEYLSNDYKWLWNTSYWTNTLAGNYTKSQLEFIDPYIKAYFISSQGEVCFSPVGCYNGIPRAGLRAVITIDQSSIKYKIFTKTDGKGTIEVVDSAFGGDSIRFKVSAKKGYKLKSLSVTTDSGENLIYNEEDFSVDKTGVYSISTNKFTMPFENVTIEARWSSDFINPSTGLKTFGLIITFVLVCAISIFLKIKNKKESMLS